MNAPLKEPIARARYLRIHLFCEITGFTEKAVRRKIEDGYWMLGREYRKAPDGSILMDIKGYNKWVEGGTAAA